MRYLLFIVALINLTSCNNEDEKQEHKEQIKIPNLNSIKETDSTDKTLETKINYQFPKELKDLKTITTQLIIDNFLETNQKTDRPWIDLIDYNHESFRPIGWSKDGKFAFLINGIGEGTGCPYFALKIIALNVNKKIWDLSVIVGDSCENEESIWNQHRSEIEKNLRANQIIQHNNFEFVKDLEKLPKISLKTHWIETKMNNDDAYEHPFSKGSAGFLKSPYSTSSITIDYYFWYDAGRGEAAVEYDITGVM